MNKYNFKRGDYISTRFGNALILDLTGGRFLNDKLINQWFIRIIEPDHPNLNKRITIFDYDIINKLKVPYNDNYK